MRKAATMPTVFRIATMLALIAVAGCADWMTVAGPVGPGRIGGYNPPKPSSDSIYIPLNFSLRPKEKYNLRNELGLVTEDRVKEFVSIGIRSLSYNYALDPGGWAVKISRDSSPAPERGLALFGLPETITYLDYRLTVNASSPRSLVLNKTRATDRQSVVLSVDKNLSVRFDYVLSLSGGVDITLRSGVADAIYFDVDMRLSLLRKSQFADDKHFAPFESLDQQMRGNIRRQIQDQLLDAYMEALNALGFSVKRGGQ